MATYNEPTRPAEFLLSEADGTLSRESITIALGNGVILPGTVLGQITEGGKYAPFDADKLDGTASAVAIALMGVDATSADAPCAVITRLAEVKSSSLIWAAANNAGDKTAGIADLAARYIVLR